MLAADEEYASYSDRRDTYRPKQDALANFKKTHMEFNNWLMCVDAPSEESEYALPDLPDEHAQSAAMDSEEQRGTKRARSPRTKARSSSSSSHGCLELSTDPIPERKRLKFSDSVEFRDDYRPSNRYSRNDEAYQKGRHAPPEGSKYLDTSGSAKTFLKFTGTKKVGKQWIDVWKDDDDDEEEAQKAEKEAKDKENMHNEEATTQPKTKTKRGEGRNEIGSSIQLDPRAQRLLRRRSASMESTTIPKRSANKSPSDRTEGRNTKMTILHIDENISHTIEKARSVTEQCADSTGDIVTSAIETSEEGDGIKANETAEGTASQPQTALEIAGFAVDADFTGPFLADSTNDDRSSKRTINADACGAAQVTSTNNQDQESSSARENEAEKVPTNGGDATLATAAVAALVPATEDQLMHTIVADPASSGDSVQGPVVQDGATAMLSLSKRGYREPQQQPLHDDPGNTSDPVTALHADAGGHKEAKSSHPIPINQHVNTNSSTNAHEGFSNATGPTSLATPTSISGTRPEPNTPHPGAAAFNSSSYAQDAQVDPVQPVPAVTAAIMTGAGEVDAIGEMRVMVSRKGKDQLG
jgi:hypothetical protein